jgi:hypothetical protein
MMNDFTLFCEKSKDKISKLINIFINLTIQ